MGSSVLLAFFKTGTLLRACQNLTKANGELPDLAGFFIKAEGRSLTFFYQTEEILLKKKIIGIWIVLSIGQRANF